MLKLHANLLPAFAKKIENQIKMISEGSCDTEGNDAEIRLCHHRNKSHFKM